jgi:hypothetical protein
VKTLKKLLIPVLCASLLAPALPVASAHAAPLAKPAVGATSSIDQVYYRRGGWGWGPGGIIGGIIAGTIVAAAITEGRARHEDIRACERDFPHFDPRTGTYINRYGEERVCPYLR